jgi:HlyD family secretion protein
VSSITPLSSVNDKEWDERVRHFIVRVRLDVTPPRLLPLMSAVVKIDTGRVLDTLVIPVAAMTVLDRQQCCVVVGTAAWSGARSSPAMRPETWWRLPRG